MGCALDDAAYAAAAALGRAGVAEPTALVLVATGIGLLPGRLRGGGRIPLERAEGVPPAWRGALLHHGELNGLAVWLLEDAALEVQEGEPAWSAAFPVWMAAAAGASSLVHVSAGSALPAEKGSGHALPLGALALLADHINLSGSTPLIGLGESRLGPLFPDVGALHDSELRKGALAICERLGLHGVEAVAACTAGPALETPAERRWYARAGAQVSVQRLAAPLLAAAHAGLGVLAISVVASATDAPLDMARIAAAARELAPAIDDLLWELSAEVQRRARADLERDAR
ncbi:MAG TPA: hypothetical protein VMS76_02175 [Planctomycetota bacterium]|nr:hypothetical protein [Planctomycetota bacterium]